MTNEMNLMKKTLKKITKTAYRKACRWIEKNGHSLILNNKDVKLPYLAGIIGGVTEPWMNSVLSQLFKETDGIFIDVGVNLGQTLLHVKTLDPNRPYIGFEPNPNCCFYVNRLIEYNDFENTTIVPVGLADKSGLGVLHFLQDHCHDAAASIVEGFRDQSRIQRKVFVPLYDFADYKSVLPDGNVSIIKIDVEGAEHLVFKALWDVICDQRPVIVLEMLPPGDTESERFERQSKIYSDFIAADYQVCRISKSPDSKVVFKKLDKYLPYTEIELSDYVIIPKESVNQFNVI